MRYKTQTISHDNCVKINSSKNGSKKAIEKAIAKNNAKQEIPVKINDKITIYVSSDKINKLGVDKIIEDYKLKCNIN